MKTENRMIDRYFDQLKKYYTKYGYKTILLWQCGSFYEVYTLKNKRGNILQSKDDFDDVFSNILKKNDYLMIKGSHATGLNKLSKNIIKGATNVI